MAGLRHRWGLDHLTGRRLGAMTLVLFVVGVLAGVAIFAAPLPAVAVGVVTAVAPPVALRRRHQMRVARAQECWPRLIDEIRVLTASAGRSIPQALFEVGSRAPRKLRPAFSAAHREWLLSTDFERTTRRLKSLLADPTADATCETLLVAHQLGGTDLDRRLEALAQDRRDDVRGRKEARARQAGARFARRFVLLVPAGMALAGMSVGNGRTAYATPLGQAAVVVAMGLILVCWLWAGRYLQGPHTERVLSG